MVDVRLKNVEESDVDTLLSEDVEFSGTAKLVKPAMIRGKIDGEIISSGNVYIEKTSEVKAVIKTANLSVKGKVEGNIETSAVLELHSTSSVKGDIKAGTVAMEGGCRFSGRMDVAE